MPIFRCFIRGDNFTGTLIGQKEPIGFYTTRLVEADSLEQAEEFALELLRKDCDLHVPPEHRTQEVKVHFEDIDEVFAETKQKPKAGFTFFTMGT